MHTDRSNKRLPGYASWFYWLLIISSLVSAISGLVMLPGVLEFKLDYAMEWRLASELFTSVAALHILVSWLLLTILGALWQSHMKAGWRKQRHLKSGLSSTACLIFLAISGAGLYYLGASKWQLIASVGHCLFGLVFIFSLAFHLVSGIKRRLAVQH